MVNPYKILSISEKATQQDIKNAYRQLAKKYHPDVNDQDPEKIQLFQKVNVSYELLSDEELRQKYDNGIIDGFGQEIQKKSKYQDQDFENTSFDAKAFYEAIRRELHKRRQEKSAATQASSREYNFTLKLTFFEAMAGCQKTLNIEDKKETFSIPAGIESGKILSFNAQGQDTEKNYKVNLKILVADHDCFVKKGNNIILDFPITLKEAISGGVINIPTIHEIVPVRLDPNTRSGTVIRLSGKGIQDPESQERGDQMTHIHIALPDHISPEFKTVIEMIEDKYPYNPRESIFKKT